MFNRLLSTALLALLLAVPLSAFSKPDSVANAARSAQQQPLPLQPAPAR